MKWSEEAWQAAQPVYNTILDMPFIKELANGTLDAEKFKYYLQQDAHYLEHFARALAIIGAKLTDVDTMLQYIRFAEGAVVVERALHDSYFKEYKIGERAEVSPTCHHYIHYLQSTAYSADACVGLAAVLPCFWIYKAVGDHIVQIAETTGNPYQNWIATYAGEEFGILVEKAIAITNDAANNATVIQQQQMTEAFMYAARLEYAFWDSAYTLEKW
ncbi:thiaminase II [Flavobacterium rhizosphaerae]|uniref:Aminopyrimidine aminohydrolase n=1 Tax=Flavobacterium rhizosphaerae TaxID=3163298 RepID=A0ABW8YU16_9FLAO